MATKTVNPPGMYPARWIQIRDIQGVASGATALVKFPKGYRYHRISMEFGNTAQGNGNAPTVAAILADIKITLGSAIQRHVSGAQLDIINSAMGAEAPYGALSVVTGGANGTGRTACPIYFSEPWRKRTSDAEKLAWVTDWLGAADSFQMELLFQAVTPSLTIMAEVDDYRPGLGPQPIVKWFQEQSNTNSATLEVANFTQGYNPNDYIQQISLFETSDNQTISKVKLVLNQNTIMDDITNTQNLAWLTQSGMKPDATGLAYHIPFDHDDRFNAIRQVASIKNSSILATFAGASAGTMQRVTQRLGLPE